MASTAAPAPEFQETQWFWRHWWGLLAALLMLAVGLISWGLTQPHRLPAVQLAVLLLLLTLGALWLLRLQVRVDEAGIHYRYAPLLNRWRHRPWHELKQVYPRTYSPLGDYGGWGIRGWPGNWAYNVWGPAGLQLVFRNGDKLLLGTQRPTELRAALATLQAADASRPIALDA